jgi:uncharacterized protein (TIGR03546 family)
MWILKIVRKLFAGLSGAESPTQIALGFGLGIMLGLVPFLSGMGILLFVVILAFKVSFPFAVVGWGAGAALRAGLLQRFLTSTGTWILWDLPLRGFWSFLLNLPVFALLGLEHHHVMGGTVVGLAALAALFYPIRFLVIRYREVVVTWCSESKAFKYVTNLWLFRILRWVFVGVTR